MKLWEAASTISTRNRSLINCQAPDENDGNIEARGGEEKKEKRGRMVSAGVQRRVGS